MKTSRLAIGSLVLSIGVIVSSGAGAGVQATKVQLAATLDAKQEVPKPKGSVAGAFGTFTGTATASADGAVVTWRLTFKKLTGSAMAAHIHVGATRRAGPVAVPLCGPCRSGAKGRANVDAATRAALVAGRAYVNVHTAANAAGEIRGQIGTMAKVRSSLTAAQEVPKPAGAGQARGVFTATVTKIGSRATVTWQLTFSGLSGPAMAAHIHVGARGKAGGVLVPLCGPCRNGARGTATVRLAAAKALEAGTAYVNVHTAKNPAGEIRGQVAALALSLTGESGSGDGGGGGGGGGDDPYPPGDNPYP